MASPAHDGKRLDLASAALGTRLRIVGARLDAADAAWLAAVGLHEGEEVVVLRRAIAAGPLHVRTGSGGEFAVARELAVRLDVLVIEGAP
ncbi:MAG: FeoA domain-containing protein [Myxococcales bacterium]|nr:FeoA domain-containing protein [Myxococcales bacterium]